MFLEYFKISNVPERCVLINKTCFIVFFIDEVISVVSYGTEGKLVLRSDQVTTWPSCVGVAILHLKKHGGSSVCQHLQCRVLFLPPASFLSSRCIKIEYSCSWHLIIWRPFKTKCTANEIFVLKSVSWSISREQSCNFL